MTKINWPLMQNNISRDDLDELIKYLQSDDPKLTHGPKVVDFENAWSNWLGVTESVMVNSGASANDLTLLALREKFGLGEIIVPGLTWVSDIASVLHSGFTPIFVDIDPHTLGMDSRKIFDAITPRTKAIFITHILGYNAITDTLLEELQRLKIPLIEDVCESHGATHNGTKLGVFGLASNFSFYYAHHLTTIEGGMVCSNDSEFIDIIRMLRSHGLVRESKLPTNKSKFIDLYPDLNSEFIFAFPAHNMRPTEINGILGLSQLSRLDHVIEVRRQNLALFLEELNSKFYFTEFATAGNSNYAFTIMLREANIFQRDRVETLFRSNGIEFRRGMSGGGNQLRQPYLKKLQNIPAPETLPYTDHVHHFSWYVGNYSTLKKDRIVWLARLLSEIK
jgi:CDP-6-deoxy-D-xylo-4-hexulose-3-dehydrase